MAAGRIRYRLRITVPTANVGSGIRLVSTEQPVRPPIQCVSLIHAAAAIMMIALISGCVNTDDPVQRKLDDGVFLRHTWPIQVMPALPVMPEFEPVGEQWYLTTDGD